MQKNLDSFSLNSQCYSEFNRKLLLAFLMKIFENEVSELRSKLYNYFLKRQNNNYTIDCVACSMPRVLLF